MAVEIPVVIDIDAAFAEAAKKVDTAVVPLQKKMDQNALAIRVHIDTKQLTIKQVLDDATLSARDLKIALSDIFAQIDKKMAAGGFDLSSGLKYSEKILLQGAAALEMKLNGVTDGSSVMAKVFSANIDRTKAKINELTLKIDDLTRKQNKYSIAAKKGAPGAQLNYTNTTKNIQKVNLELQAARAYLGTVLTALDDVTAGSKRAATAMRTMKTPAMEMAEQWRRGAEYVAKYNSSLTIANSKMVSLIKSGASLLALHSATSFIRNVREVTSEFEMQRVALGGIIQDTERAGRLFKQIKAAAIQSPFEIKDLVTFTKQLSAYRIETESLFDITMKLADVSAGLGVDMNRLVLAYGQVRAASVLRGQELRQFTEAGIPLVELLAKKFQALGREGTTTADVFELISKRAVPFSMIAEIFDDMTSAGGMFYKMQEKQSETLKGQWMKLKDALSIMYDEIGNTSVVHGAMESLLKDAMLLFQNWREVARVVKVVVAAMAAYKVAIINTRIAQNALTATEVAEISALELNAVGRSKVIASLFGETAATKVQIAAGNLYVKVKKREMMATNLFTKALYKMIAALLRNPYAIAIAGIAALVAIIVRFSKSAKEAAITNDEFQKSITKFDKAKSRANDIDELCDKYDKLASKANKTKEEMEQLARVTKELAKAYPSAISGSNEHTNAVNINTEAIRERNKETKEAIRLSLEQDKKRAESRVQELQDEYNRIADILQRGTVQKGAYGGTWFEPISEDDRATFGKRLIEIEGQLADYGESVRQAQKSLDDFKEGLIGPPIPEFFGDEWRMNMDSYSVTLKDAIKPTKAFTTDQIRQFKSAEEAVGQAIKEYKDLRDAVDFYTKAIQNATGARKQQLQSILDEKNLMLGMYAQIITDYNAWNLLKDKGDKGYQQDPFIKQMDERMKFMKDFKKGYDDLNKYLSSTDALSKISEKMKDRGISIGLPIAEQNEAAESLSEWYQKARETAFAKVQKSYGVKGSMTEFLRREINDTTDRGKALRDFQKLIQSLWDAQTDLDTSEMEKNLENAMKKVKDEIKQSEVARNFYQDILDTTGDQELAAQVTMNVYGDVGKSFRENMQKELKAAFLSLDWNMDEMADWDSPLGKAIENIDWNTILANLDRFPKEWQKRLQEMAEADQKYNVDMVKNLVKSLAGAKTYSEKRIQLANQTAQRLAQINEMDVDEDFKAQLRKQNEKKEADEAAKLLYDAFKETPMYVELFSNLDQASSRMLTNMRNNLVGMKDKWDRNLDPTQLKELQSRIDELDKQIAARNPFKALINSMREYKSLLDKTSRDRAEEQAVMKTNQANAEKTRLNIALENLRIAEETYDADSKEVQAAKDAVAQQRIATDKAEEEAKAAQETANAFGDAADHIRAGAEAMAKWSEYASSVANDAKKIASSFGSEDFAERFGIIADGATGFLSGAVDIAKGMALVSAGDLTGILPVINGLAEAVSSVVDAYHGINIKNIDESIEEQDKLLEDLEYTYDRLEKAIAKSFGSDYIYNYREQLRILNAEAAAYAEQARLESEKGKKADEAKIEEYEKKEREALDRIKEMRPQLSEFFAGTDITSAAKDFATAWIDAYRQFGNTTDAMGQKFKDMVDNMIINSLAGQAIQSMLKPIFDAIDAAAYDGKLTAKEIAAISALASSTVPEINDSMTNLMSQLAHFGLNMRDNASGLTGIARDIQGASESSINGLAAAYNTQNFYISRIDQNVALIVAALTGESVAGPNGAPAAAATSPYQDQMLEYVSSIPQMRDDIAAIRSLLSRVIIPKGITATHAVATRL